MEGEEEEDDKEEGEGEEEIVVDNKHSHYIIVAIIINDFIVPSRPNFIVLLCTSENSRNQTNDDLKTKIKM